MRRMDIGQPTKKKRRLADKDQDQGGGEEEERKIEEHLKKKEIKPVTPQKIKMMKEGKEKRRTLRRPGRTVTLSCT